jgi:hypothetical protein
MKRTAARTAPSHPRSASDGPAGWRGDAIARVRRWIREADARSVEERKWRKPSNPAGVSVWSHDGIICTGEIYQRHLRFTFAKGAALEDPDHVFNSGFAGGTYRAIVLREGDGIDERAFKSLVRAAVALNVG